MGVRTCKSSVLPYNKLMEYKGFDVRQSKNGNVIIREIKTGATYVISRTGGFLNDRQLQEFVDKQAIRIRNDKD